MRAETESFRRDRFGRAINRPAASRGAALLPAFVLSAAAIAPLPFYWNPPGWVIALSNPATSRQAAMALLAPLACLAAMSRKR